MPTLPSTARQVGADPFAPPPPAAAQDEEITKSGNQIFQAALGITIGYIALGVVTFSLLEGWNFLDTFYFVVVTLTTVGYGDQEPWVNQGAMLFCAFYCLIGILLIGTALGIIAAEVIEARDKALKTAQSEALATMTKKDSPTNKRSGMTIAKMSNELNLQFDKYCAPLR